MPESAKTPLARLVLCIVCLSVAGTLVAGVHYFAIVQPQQNGLQAPDNAWYPCEPHDCTCRTERCQSNCADGECMKDCYIRYYSKC